MCPHDRKNRDKLFLGMTKLNYVKQLNYISLSKEFKDSVIKGQLKRLQQRAGSIIKNTNYIALQKDRKS